jgi:hypothetical protein
MLRKKLSEEKFKDLFNLLEKRELKASLENRLAALQNQKNMHDEQSGLPKKINKI